MKILKLVLISSITVIMFSQSLVTYAATNDGVDSVIETTIKEANEKELSREKSLKAGQTQSFNAWFPDARLAAKVATAFGMQVTDSVSEEQLATLTSLDCQNSSIADMTGIEKLTGLTKLICTRNNITTLDLSKNTNLTYLECNLNKLTSLDVTPLTKLTHLNCDTNKLTKLDVSQNPLLTYLSCARNTLAEIDVSHNTQLTELNCDTNNLTKLDLSQNIQLTNLDCSGNKLTELDVTPLIQLTYFDCGVNPLTELDVSTLTKLTTLECIQTDLLEIDLTNNTQLTNFKAAGCEKIKELDVTHNTKLYSLDCQSTGIAELDLSQNPQLVYLYLTNTELTKLDVSHNTKLKRLTCINAHIQDFSSVGKIPALNNNLDAEGQTITMPKETLTNNSLTIAVSPDLLDQFGNPMNIEPGDGGVYDQATNTITWENLSTDNPAVTYTFTSENGAIVGTVTTPFEAPQPIKGEDVTVHYLDDKGEKLAADEVLSGNLDDPYTSSAKDIPDYTLTTTPDNATGTFTTASQSVTYVYTKNIVAAEPVTVNYVDDTGKMLAPSETLNGNVGDTYNATAKQIEGFTLSAEPTNATGQFTSSAQTVNYIYTKNPAPEKGIVEIHYVDENNKQLSSATEISGKVGDNYSTEPKTIDGYTLKITPDNATGTFTTVSQTVTYVYTKNIETAQPITVNYVDANGKTLAPSETLNGTIGDTYKTTAKQIDGYTLSAEPINATGQFTSSAQTVNYIYTKNTNIDQPLAAKKPTNTTPTKPSNLKTTEVKKTSDILPKTGDSAPWKSALLGVLLSSTALIIWKRKNSKNAGQD